ncbi:MAG: MBL fold metallo-hydrolase, partial [Anaerolineales bacterium]|nr:MBL fold metallo-hydrolase [Anaerolineales bacterium]
MNEIIPGVYRLSLGMVNVYLIEIDGGLWLVDTGTRGHGRRIVKAVNELAGKSGPLKHIAITHEHADHTGG